MIEVGTKVRVLDQTGQRYKKIADVGYVTSIIDDKIFVSIMMHRSSPYFPLEFDRTRCVIID